MASPRNGQNRGNNPTARKSAGALELADRRAKAMQLRLQGMTYDQIALQVGVSAQQARRDIQALMREYMLEHEATTIPEYRAVETQRLDDMVREAYKIVLGRGSAELRLKAMDRVFRAIHLRSELLGLKVPIEVNLRQVEETQQDRELESLIAQAELTAEATRQQIVDGYVVSEEVVEDGGSAAVA